MVPLKDFDEETLKVDKKFHKYIDIYYIGYITIKKIDDYENIHSIDPWYLIIHSATWYFTEENDNEYLILDSKNKCKKIWSGIRAKIKKINCGK